MSFVFVFVFVATRLSVFFILHAPFFRWKDRCGAIERLEKARNEAARDVTRDAVKFKFPEVRHACSVGWDTLAFLYVVSYSFSVGVMLIGTPTQVKPSQRVEVLYYMYVC